MSNPGRFSKQRVRTFVGASVVAVVLAAAGVMGGVGFAKNPSTAQAQYGKVVICHKTHSKKKPSHTITVAAAAVPAHLRHGDTLGACGTTTTTTSTTTPTTTTTSAATAASGPGKSGTHGKGHGGGHGGGHGKK